MPSAVIRRFSYDPDRRELTITFNSGQRYAYLDVPPRTHDELREAFSKGRYFGARIRDRFRWRRLDDRGAPPESAPAPPSPGGPASPPPAAAAR